MLGRPRKAPAEPLRSQLVAHLLVRMSRMTTQTTRSHPLQRIWRFLWRTTATQIVTVLVTLAVTGVVAFVYGRITADSSVDPIDVQLAELRESAARHSEQLFIRPGSLHGGLSYVVVSEEQGSESPHAVEAPSDTVRIYDVEHGRLREAFSFRPAPTSLESWRYRLDTVQDLQNTGAEEVVGGFWLFIDSAGNRAFVPTIISWDSAARHYVIEPLLPKPVAEAERHFRPFRGVGGSTWWRVEANGATLDDVRAHIQVHGYGGADYIIRTITSFLAPSTTAMIVVGAVGSREHDDFVVRLTGEVLKPTLPRVSEQECPALHPWIHAGLRSLQSEIARGFGRSGELC